MFCFCLRTRYVIVIKRIMLFSLFLFQVLYVDIPRVVWKGFKMGGKSDVSQHLYRWHSGFLRCLTLQSYKLSCFYVLSLGAKTSQNVVILTLFHANVHLGGHPGYLRRAISHIQIRPESSERLETIELMNNISPSLPVCSSPSVHKWSQAAASLLPAAV